MKCFLFLFSGSNCQIGNTKRFDLLESSEDGLPPTRFDSLDITFLVASVSAPFPTVKINSFHWKQNSITRIPFSFPLLPFDLPPPILYELEISKLQCDWHDALHVLSRLRFTRKKKSSHLNPLQLVLSSSFLLIFHYFVSVIDNISSEARIWHKNT